MGNGSRVGRIVRHLTALKPEKIVQPELLVTELMRLDHRRNNELRPVKITPSVETDG